MNEYIAERLRARVPATPTGESLPPIEKLSVWLPMTNEVLIDAGFGTPEMIAADKAATAASRARWLALPFYVRWSRIAQSRWWDFRYRLGRAMRAYRGDDE